MIRITANTVPMAPMMTPTRAGVFLNPAFLDLLSAMALDDQSDQGGEERQDESDDAERLAWILGGRLLVVGRGGRTAAVPRALTRPVAPVAEAGSGS